MAVPPVFVSGQVLTAAQMNAVGYWVTKPLTSFSAVTSVIVNNCFSSDYESYLVILRYSTTLTSGINLTLRAGGVNTTTNYNRQDLTASSGTVSSTRTTGGTTFGNIAGSTEGVISSSYLFINGPALASPTSLFSMNARNQANSYLEPVLLMSSQNQSSSTAFDGFELTVASGTTTGNYTVYGMRP